MLPVVLLCGAGTYGWPPLLRVAVPTMGPGFVAACCTRSGSVGTSRSLCCSTARPVEVPSPDPHTEVFAQGAAHLRQTARGSDLVDGLLRALGLGSLAIAAALSASGDAMLMVDSWLSWVRALQRWRGSICTDHAKWSEHPKRRLAIEPITEFAYSQPAEDYDPMIVRDSIAGISAQIVAVTPSAKSMLRSPPRCTRNPS